MSLLRCVGLGKTYDLGTQKLEVLKGLDLSIDPGEYVAIMGPSGSGKSTMMNIIGCLDVPTEGEYYLNNQDVSKLSDDELLPVTRAFNQFLNLANLAEQDPKLLQDTLVVDFNVAIHPKIAATGATVKYGDLSNSETLHHLGEITGEVTTDEILGNIFKNFCIGK